MHDRQSHWDHVYEEKNPTLLSWHQAHAARSVDLIRRANAPLDCPVLDVGGGTSVLVDELLALGYHDLTVLDVSESALTAARERLGSTAAKVKWWHADIVDAHLPASHYCIWHDRAVFHFLTDPHDRARYLSQIHTSLMPDGVVVLGTFAEDAPPRCSGLDVRRYSADSLAAELGSVLRPLQIVRDEHRTPSGLIQPFTFGLFVGSPGTELEFAL